MAIYDSKYTRTQIDEGIGASYVPTLNSAPTSSTLTYTRSDLPSGSQTVSFVVGQLCRVAVTGGYDFYELQDISNNTATWRKVPSNVVSFSSDSGDGVIPSDGIRAETVSAGATISVNPDVVTVVSGNVGTAAITLQVPSDNLAHVWDILMTTDSSVSITIATSTSATIKVPSGFVVGTSKSCEIRVVGVGSIFYLAYGEFA